MIGSLLVMDFSDRAAVDSFLAGDPYSRAGLFASVRVSPWRKVIPGSLIASSNQVREAAMNHWLVKSEPGVYPGTISWPTSARAGTACAISRRKNMKDMKKGDRALFYHSGEGPSVVGVCEVAQRSTTPIPRTRPGASAWWMWPR